MEESSKQGSRRRKNPLQLSAGLREALHDLVIVLALGFLVGVGLVLTGKTLFPYVAVGAVLAVISGAGLALSFLNPVTTQREALASTTAPSKASIRSFGQNRNRAKAKSPPVTMEQRLSPVLGPIYRIFRVSNLEDLLKRLLKLVFTVILIIPIILLPLYFFFFTLLHL